MKIIDIDKDPILSGIKNEVGGHIFAGHINEIVGVNYISTEEREIKGGKQYHHKELIDNVASVKTIWINHSRNNKEFSVKIENKEVIREFIKDYEKLISQQGNYFVVCNDAAYQSHNPVFEHKNFFPIDSIEEYKEEFKIWKI